MAGIYIHIPFCKQRCKYCAFYSTTLHNLQDRYTNALCLELGMRKNYIKEGIDTIYFGGGTPSVLKKEQLQKIINTIEENFEVSPQAERTIEANPDDLTHEYLEALHSLSFNRISMGVQSFNDKQLQRLGRRHTAQKVREAVDNARNVGFENISIDLIFALPASTSQEWLYDLDQAISLHPTHISAYNLTYEEGTPLYNLLKKGEITPLSEEENIEQFEMLIEKLSQAGYVHYEISNFAFPGKESKHNSSYWHDIPYLGCGAAAHSYNRTSRQWNISDIKKYIEAIEEGSMECEIEELSENDRYNDALLTRLRTADGLPLEWLRENFDNKYLKYLQENATSHIKNGTLEEKGNCIALTKKGIFISDAIIRDLIYIE